jgi:acyl-CoA thioesterase FadM
MGWTAIFLLKKVVLTKRMSVDFLKPIMVNQELFVQGEVVEMRDDRNALVKAAITSPDGEISAESQGVFRVFSIEEATQLGILEKEILEEIREKFSKLS